nr:carbohydrate ABC transporter permease [uncultured Devosia sp.]
MSNSAHLSRRIYKILTTAIFVILSLAIIIPVGWVAIASIKHRSEFYGSPWTLPQGFYWQNYIEAFITADMASYFVNSIIVTLLALTICLAVSVPCAYAVARFDFKAKKLIETLLMAGLFINVNYIVVPIFLLLLGWDQALRAIVPQAFLLDNLFILAVVYAATTIPFTVFLLLNYFRTIPKVYEEAALVDGSSRLRTMLTVMLPMALPAINTVVLFNFLSFWNDFIISLTLMTGENRTLQVGLLNLFQAQRAAADYGRLYAGMVIVIVPVLIVYALVQKRLLQGATQGGIKG